MNRPLRGKQALSLVVLAAALGLFTHSVALGAPARAFSSANGLLASAGVGVSLEVAPNPYNSLAAQLEAKAADLTEREQRIERLETTTQRENDLGLYSLAMSIALFTLLAVNFFLDWRRGRLGESSGFVIDTRRRA